MSPFVTQKLVPLDNYLQMKNSPREYHWCKKQLLKVRRLHARLSMVNKTQTQRHLLRFFVSDC